MIYEGNAGKERRGFDVCCSMDRDGNICGSEIKKSSIVPGIDSCQQNMGL